MYFYALFLLLLSILSNCHGNTLQGTIDLKRLQNILQENVKSQDITSLYYSVKGLAELNADIPNICEILKNIKYDPKNIEQVFQVANAAAITSCQNFMRPEILSPATQTLDRKDATIADIYHAVFTLRAFGKGTVYDKEDALKNLIQLLKKDDSPANYGYVFSLCEHMGCGAWTAAHADAVLLAADEADAALHFEGGLPATATLLAAIHRTFKNLKKPSPLTEEQRYKFAEYLLTRRSVNTPKGACLLLEAANALADDEPTPISISIKGKKFITSESDSIEFSISDLVGRPLRLLKPDEVLAQSGTRLADDVVVLSKQPLTQKPNEPTTFVLNLSKIKAQYGLYKIALSAGSKTTNVNVAVLGEIRVSTVEVGVGDVDGTTSPKLTTVAYPNKLTDKLQADHLQKVSLKFSVRDKYDKPVLVQQAFVRVAAADDETIFVAEPDNTKAYKVELRRFQPHRLARRDVLFNFGKEAAARGGGAAAGAARGARPELAHSFRAAEARPARLLSDVFAAACGAPLLLLLALWARLGLNAGRLPAAPSALAFHASLGAVLALYACVWLRLSMFEAARYVLPLAALTFVSGQRLLRRLARDKQR
ncbi:unnamed protein product [Spodoptera littoralis]|uniref:Dolichyl-diphosphooligosaccharide--protein glycosyltransferase subunit 2 n=1 Tax=Spodoptera littoralis TaxID=7109 RepID=A0A9P0I5Q5_SPOLI|nr:unnamed protein product [Spodoptera littoralis]CAH1639378.1 unnamed protein product [Spodoptera littoralis]